MKKIQKVAKPFLSIVFGALLLLTYLNWLSSGGGALVIGVIALLISLYYLGAGITEAVAGDKLPLKTKKVFDIIDISLFSAFASIYYLLYITNLSDQMGPTGWIVVLAALLLSLALAIFSIIARLVSNPVLKRLDVLFSALFMAALVLTLLFDSAGNPIKLGSIDVISLVIYALFGMMLLESLTNKDTKSVETPSDNVQGEPTSVDEAEPEDEKEPENKTEEEPTPEQGE
ncbi:MAG: hypothetical protein ACI4QP_07175 [Candidatus Enteromonas sp.]